MVQKGFRLFPHALWVAALLFGLWLGYHWGWRAAGTETPVTDDATTAVWSCSMHPSVRQATSGLCPLCAMDLVQGVVGEESSLTLGDQARRLASVSASRVTRQPLQIRVHAPGKLQYDKNATRRISALLPAEIRVLNVPYAGTRVNGGELLVTLFSGELLSGQRQYLEAVEALGDRPLDVRSAASLRLLAAREKLLGWGLTEAGLANLKASNQARPFHEIRAPFNGLVTKVHVTAGEFANQGVALFDLADDFRLWLEFDVHEHELPWIAYGQTVDFQASAIPGQPFEGEVIWIEQRLDPVKRTARIRARVDNQNGLLKEEMLVRASVLVPLRPMVPADVASTGWRCPEHTSETSNRAGTCSRCALPLAPVHRFASEEVVPVLAIPREAALVTGRRAVVYVTSGPDSGEYEVREVVLGPRAGAWYPVFEGLEEGEWVVSSGAFKLDSELQFQGQGGMMQLESAPNRESLRSSTKRALDRVLDAYLALQVALSEDQSGVEESRALLTAVEAMRGASQGEPAVLARVNDLVLSVSELAAAQELALRREHFARTSDQLAGLAENYQIGRQLYRVHCPMAFDNKGADWLQAKPDIANPYFGSAMYACGQVTDELTGTEQNHTMP